MKTKTYILIENSIKTNGKNPDEIIGYIATQLNIHHIYVITPSLYCIEDSNSLVLSVLLCQQLIEQCPQYKENRYRPRIIVGATEVTSI